jgi:hypothetical protein
MAPSRLIVLRAAAAMQSFRQGPGPGAIVQCLCVHGVCALHSCAGDRAVDRAVLPRLMGLRRDAHENETETDR